MRWTPHAEDIKNMLTLLKQFPTYFRDLEEVRRRGLIKLLEIGKALNQY